MIKSPLKTPTNKQFSCSRALQALIPAQSVINSYLFYDGALEFSLAKNNRFVIAHTSKYVIYEFWKCAAADPERVAELAGYLFPLENKRMFEVYQDRFAHFRDPFIRAATFFVLNQCSDSGMVSSGYLKNSESDPLLQSYLKTFSPYNFHMKLDEEEDIVQSFEKTQDEEYILLPIGQFSANLFEEGKSAGLEETKIYHKKIKEFFVTTNKKTILLYYGCPRIFDWYKDYNLKMYNKWGVETDQRSSCKEVVIANF